MQRSRWFLCLLALGAAGLVGVQTDAPPAMVDVLLGQERVRVTLASLAERVPLADDEEFRVAEIGRDARTSHHVVAIRTAETPHRHDRHDLFVVMVRGHGTWRVGDETLPVGEGSLLSIPRGTVHAFANESGENAIAYAVSSPPFDGKDRVETNETR
jgi:mannose-6-phosphate isomerase-like protein (cupin superfamily)